MFLLPLCVLWAGQDVDVPMLTPEPSGQPQPTPAPGAWDGGHRIKVLLDDGGVEEMAMSDYLWRVVAAEMPAAFETEALKAQSVCART